MTEKNRKVIKGEQLTRICSEDPTLFDTRASEDEKNLPQILNSRRNWKQLKELKFRLYLKQKKKVDLGPCLRSNTVVIDLDETLICSRAQINLDGEEEFLISLRPHCREMLKAISMFYEIIIFTAATEECVLKIKNYIDPDRAFVKALLFRQHCILTKEGYYVKDLRILTGRDLNKVVIVDSSIFSFAFQLENGIRIPPFDGDSNDQELFFLEECLKNLANEINIKSANAKNIELIQIFCVVLSN